MVDFVVGLGHVPLEEDVQQLLRGKLHSTSLNCKYIRKTSCE